MVGTRGDRGRQVAAVGVVAHEEVAEAAQAVQLRDVGEVLHRVPQQQRAVPPRAEGLQLRPLHHGVRVDQGGQQQGGKHDDEEPARGLLTAPATAQRWPRGSGAVRLGAGHVEHQNRK